MANWCISTGQPPQVYRELTRQQRDAFLRRAYARR